jgi:hypothetical protein
MQAAGVPTVFCFANHTILSKKGLPEIISAGLYYGKQIVWVYKQILGNAGGSYLSIAF